MRFHHSTKASPWFVAAALVFGTVAANAAGGFTQEKEALVKTGMSQDQILLALGQPSSVQSYHHGAGPTWTYEVPAS